MYNENLSKILIHIIIDITNAHDGNVLVVVDLDEEALLNLV